MTDAFVARLSPLAQEGAIRAISTMMVMNQSYHPNMLILLYQFSRDLSVQDQGDYDDWTRFLDVLHQFSAEEQFFLLDLLSVAAAFDGHLSKLERQQLPMAFGVHNSDYMERIRHLRDCLVSGRIHAAQQACRLDFLPG